MSFLSAEKQAAAAAITLDDSSEGEDNEDEKATFDSLDTSDSINNPMPTPAKQKRPHDLTAQQHNECATLLAQHLPAAMFLHAASLAVNATDANGTSSAASGHVNGGCDNKMPVGDARQHTVDALVAAWESFHELHVHLARHPVLDVRTSLAASLSCLALAVGAPNAARLADPVFDALLAGPRASFSTGAFPYNP